MLLLRRGIMAPKLLQQKKMLVNHWGSIRCRENSWKVMILKNRGGGGHRYRTLESVASGQWIVTRAVEALIHAQRFWRRAKGQQRRAQNEPQIPRPGLKPSVGMTRLEGDGALCRDERCLKMRGDY